MSLRILGSFAAACFAGAVLALLLPVHLAAQGGCGLDGGGTSVGERGVCPAAAPTQEFTISAQCRNDCGRVISMAPARGVSVGSCTPHLCFPWMEYVDRLDFAPSRISSLGVSSSGHLCQSRNYQLASISCTCPPCAGGGAGTSTNTTPGEDPLLISLADENYALSSHERGVKFDLNADGERELTAWTVKDGDDAFLVLDRDMNGEIDSGTELFGDRTLQLPSDEPNGFRALELFDDVLNGGNDDGLIDAADRIYFALQLWVDADHDGKAGAGELQALSDRVSAISLDYHRAYQRDENGHEFRFWAPVERPAGAAGAAVAWNVFFARPNSIDRR